MGKRFWTVCLLPFGAFASDVRIVEAEFMGEVTERRETFGSGTMNDPLITQIWEDFDAGGGIGSSHLVFESTYYGNADWGDNRDSLGEGQVWYESVDDDKINEWQWTNGFESGSQQVLTSFGGYHVYFKGDDVYTVFGLVHEKEEIQDLSRSNATNATFDPVAHATQLVTGTDTCNDFVWNEQMEYMTLE